MRWQKGTEVTNVTNGSGFTGSVTIDCDDCAVRGPGCDDCVVSVLLGVPETLLDDERRALEVLADAGLAPRLRLVPIGRPRATPGAAGVA